VLHHAALKGNNKYVSALMCNCLRDVTDIKCQGSAFKHSRSYGRCAEILVMDFYKDCSVMTALVSFKIQTRWQYVGIREDRRTNCCIVIDFAVGV